MKQYMLRIRMPRSRRFISSVATFLCGGLALVGPLQTRAADSAWVGDTAVDASWLVSENWSVAPAAGNRVLIGEGSSVEAPVWLHTALPDTNIVWGALTVTNIIDITTNWVDGIEFGEIESVVTNSVEEIIPFATTNIIAKTQYATGLLINNGGALRITSADAKNYTLNLAGITSQIGYGGTPGHLVVEDGGWIHSTRPVLFADNAASTGVLHIVNGGRVSMRANYMSIGESGIGTAVVDGYSRLETLNAVGSTIASTSANLFLGYNAGSKGFLYVTNSVVSTSYHIYVGYGGFGYLQLVAGTNTTQRQLNVGVSAGSTGVVELVSGRASYGYGCLVGNSGYGEMTIADGFTYNSREFQLGVERTGRGIVEAGAASVSPSSGLKVGMAGYGEFWMRGTSFDNDRTTHSVRTTSSGFGLLRGYGRFNFSRVTAATLFQNSGLVVADGFGEERDMDFSKLTGGTSYPTQITNPIENDSTNGWYAVNKGRIRLNTVTMTATSNGAISYGETATDEEIDLVNSARFIFSEDSAWLNKNITGALYAADRTDIPDAESLNGRGTVAGVWHFTTTVAAPYSVEAHFRYDHAMVGGLSATLLKHDGTGWRTVSATELPGYRLATPPLDSLGWFAVVSVPHSTLLIVK